MEGRKWRERLAVAGSLMAIAAVGLTGCGGATGNPGAANTPATVTTATTAAATTGAKVSANTGTADEIQASLESAGVANAGRWTREVMEYRPYDAGDSTLAQLRQELLKYNLPRTSCSGFWAPSNREPGRAPWRGRRILAIRALGTRVRRGAGHDAGTRTRPPLEHPDPSAAVARARDHRRRGNATHPRGDPPRPRNRHRLRSLRWRSSPRACCSRHCAIQRHAISRQVTAGRRVDARSRRVRVR